MNVVLEIVFIEKANSKKGFVRVHNNCTLLLVLLIIGGEIGASFLF